jgi:Ribbon-helix-helix protein, copG family
METTGKRRMGRPRVPLAQRRFGAYPRVYAVRLATADASQLEAACARQGLSISELIRRLVRQALAQEVN